ncbi:DUF4345 domain-containing protein [Pseudomonas sp. GCM10022186]|uniref:DUF4345 domain-containing protein n=1 Tax=Pseudomonas sp. GCM10022186 TaxID=3252650 RepID=UPI0036191BB8
MLLARLVLILQVVVFAGFGLAYWFRPYEMANLNGMLLMEAASVSNVRVYYGGLQVGLALFLLWSLRGRELMRAALVMLLLMQTMLVLARIGSLWLDDGTLQNFDISSLIYKLVSALLAAVALGRLAQHHVPAETEPIADLDDDLESLPRDSVRRSVMERADEAVTPPPSSVDPDRRD